MNKRAFLILAIGFAVGSSGAALGQSTAPVPFPDSGGGSGGNSPIKITKPIKDDGSEDSGSMKSRSPGSGSGSSGSGGYGSKVKVEGKGVVRHLDCGLSLHCQ